MKRVAILALLAAGVCGICPAAVKNLVVYDRNNTQIGTHNGVTSLSFANGKLTVNTPENSKEYDMANIGEFAVNDGPTNVIENITSGGIVTVLSNGTLYVKGGETLKQIDVYSVAGELLASVKPASFEASLSVNSSEAVILARVKTDSSVTVVKLINR